MNKDLFEGKWNQVKGKVKEKWGKLTDNDLTQINGKRDQLVGKLQERYGYQKEQAERELRDLEGRICNTCNTTESSHGKREEAFSGSAPSNAKRNPEAGTKHGNRQKDDR